jgi:hypothetical protein
MMKSPVKETPRCGEPRELLSGPANQESNLIPPALNMRNTSIILWQSRKLNRISIFSYQFFKFYRKADKWLFYRISQGEMQIQICKWHYIFICHDKIGTDNMQ